MLKVLVSMKRHAIVALIVILAMFMGGVMACQSPPDSFLSHQKGHEKSGKVKLVFVIDQGLGRNIVTCRDTVAMERVAVALKDLQKNYDVYALFGPHVADRASLEMMLDICLREKIPFMFDAISSDGMALGAMPQTAAADEAHGVEISLADLKKYKKRYGKYLAGIRFMEVFGADFTNICIHSTNPEWKHEGFGKMPGPDDNFFHPELVRGYFAFARDHGMFVQWSDFHWQKNTVWDKRQVEREAQLIGMLKEFPGLVTVTYANNEPVEMSKPLLGKWTSFIDYLPAEGARDFGLSDQAWLNSPDPMACPVEDMIRWADSALDAGCRYVQFEPGFYYFNLPGGTLGPSPDYTQDPEWKDRGFPKENYDKLVTALNQRAEKRSK